MQSFKANMKIFLLLMVYCLGLTGQVLSNCASSQHDQYHCYTTGCFLDKLSNVCSKCQECSESNLKTDCHPTQCRSMPFPQFCSRRAWQGEQVLSKMIEISLESQLLGNFSQHNDRWIVFFYKEESEEEHQVIYSRVGKVCAHEWEKDKREWNTFQKARLLCKSEGGEEFNFIADVKKIGEADPIYYGFFTKNRIGSENSALCKFPMGSISNVITKGAFMDPLAISRNNRDEVDSSCAPVSRAGLCNGNNLTEWETAFSRTHSLMYDVVEDSSPLLTASGHFTTAAYHEKIASDGVAYTVFFIGTEEGKILKYLETKNDQANFLEEITLIPAVAVEILAIQNESLLLVSSKEEKGPFSIPLQRCNQMSNCSCYQDPYCAWNIEENKCEDAEFSSGDDYNRSAGMIVLCARSGLDEPLLVTNHSLHDPPPTVVYTEEPYEIDEPGESNNAKEVPSFHISPFIIIVIAVVCIGMIFLIVYGLRRHRKYHPVSSLPPTFKSTWTTIEIILNNSSYSADWKIDDVIDRPKPVRRCGRIVRCIFNNLVPMTPYTVRSGDGTFSKEVTTEGPNVEVQEDSISTKSVVLRVSGMNKNFIGSIVMSSTAGFGDREKPIVMDGSVIMMDGLVPNLKYTLKVKLDDTSAGYAAQPTVVKEYTTVTTKEESFRIERTDGENFLVWDEIDSRISQLTFVGCCLQSATAKPEDRRLNIGTLPEIDDLTSEVKATMNILGSGIVTWRVAELVLDVQNGETISHECNKNVSFLLSLGVLERQPLGQTVALRLNVYRIYCNALGHDDQNADVFFESRGLPDDKLLQPLRERNGGDDQLLVELLRALQESFDKTGRDRSSGWWLDCQQIYTVIETLRNLHKNCPACDFMYRKVKHKWVCTGLNSQAS